MDILLEYDWIAFVHLLKINVPYLYGSVSQFYPIPLIDVFIPSPIPTIIITVYLQEILKLSTVISQLFSSFKNCFNYSSSIAFPCDFWMCLPIYKKSCWHFDWTCANFLDYIEEHWHVWILLIWTQYISPFIWAFFNFFHQPFLIFSM